MKTRRKGMTPKNRRSPSEQTTAEEKAQWPALDGSQATIVVKLQKTWLLQKLLGYAMLITLCCLWLALEKDYFAYLVLFYLIWQTSGSVFRMLSPKPALIISSNGIEVNLESAVNEHMVPWRSIGMITLERREGWHYFKKVERPSITIQVKGSARSVSIAANRGERFFDPGLESRSNNFAEDRGWIKEIGISEDQVKCGINQLHSIITSKRDESRISHENLMIAREEIRI